MSLCLQNVFKFRFGGERSYSPAAHFPRCAPGTHYTPASYSHTLKIEEVCSYKTSIIFYQSTQLYISQDGILQTHVSCVWAASLFYFLLYGPDLKAVHENSEQPALWKQSANTAQSMHVHNTACSTLWSATSFLLFTDLSSKTNGLAASPGTSRLYSGALGVWSKVCWTNCASLFLFFMSWRDFVRYSREMGTLWHLL